MTSSLFLRDRKTLWITGLFMAAVYCCGLFIPLMDYDSAHHAGIALHMYLTGNYANLVDNGEAYLDKPHLLFWLAALSYKIIGVTSFAYRLPSFLFSFLAIFSTYRLGRLLYNDITGKLAALILCTAFAFAVSIYDVRMEGLLTGSVIFATWQLNEYLQRKKLIHLVLAALGLAAGFSTKGMIGVAIPAMALFIQIVYTRRLKLLLDLKWLLLLFLFALFISPVVYCYYLQFDLHPETIVKGQHNISGTRFILWSQSFKRMSGESDGTNQADFFFFFHTYLWAFLPWSILGIYAIVPKVKSFIRTRFRVTDAVPEAVSAGSFIFFMVLFSFSRFKLPHYLNCLFPFISVFLAGYLIKTAENERKQRSHWITQNIVSSIVIALAVLLSGWAFPVAGSWKAIPLLLLLFGWIAVFFVKGPPVNKYVLVTAGSALLLLASLFVNFYPRLLKYQAGNQLASRAHDERIAPEKIFYLRGDIHSPSFDFYTAWLHQPITIKEVTDSAHAVQPVWIYTSQPGLDSLRKNAVHTGRIFSNPDFRVSVLTFPFINPATRSRAITQTYLIEVL